MHLAGVYGHRAHHAAPELKWHPQHCRGDRAAQERPSRYLDCIWLSAARFKSSQLRKGTSRKKRSCCSATLAGPATVPPSSQSWRRRGCQLLPRTRLSGSPMTQHKRFGLPGRRPNRDPACQLCWSGRFTPMLWGRFWSAFAGKSCPASAVRLHRPLVVLFRLAWKSSTGHLERRLFAFLQQPASPDASQALCLHM